MSRSRDSRYSARGLLIAFALLLLTVGLVISWHLTGFASSESIVPLLLRARSEPLAPAITVIAFVVAGVVLFPMSVLILAAAAVFGPWFGFLYSAIGMTMSGLLMYCVGARLGKRTVSRFIEARWPRAQEVIKKPGIPLLVAFRLVAVTPFTVTNLLLGAGGVAFVDFAVGSAIGLAPGLLIMSIAGDRIVAMIAQPTAEQIGLFALSAAAYLSLIFGAQKLLRRSRAPR